MALKDWKIKQKTINFIQYNSKDDSIYLKKSPNSKKWQCFNYNGNLRLTTLDSKSQALKFAKKYMRNH